MRVDLQNAEAVSEIEELMARFGLSAETVIERVIIDAGCWMPMETLADSHWVNRKIFDPKPSLPVVEKNPLPFAKDWDVKVISDPPHFELTHNSGFVVSLSVYDNWGPLWQKAPGLIYHLFHLRRGPTTSAPPGFSKTPSQRQALISQARKIVERIDHLSIMTGPEKDAVCEYIEAKPPNPCDDESHS